MYIFLMARCQGCFRYSLRVTIKTGVGLFRSHDTIWHIASTISLFHKAAICAHHSLF